MTIDDTPTAATVAEWMVGQLEGAHWLYQETAVYQIRSKFGAQFTYNNASGNLAIGKDVLKVFRKLTEDTVIWERGTRAWRKRVAHDKPSRGQE